MQIRFFAFFLLLFAGFGCSQQEGEPESLPTLGTESGSWQSSLEVSTVDEPVSSSKLALSWEAPEEEVEIYRVSMTDAVQGSSFSFEVAGDELNATAFGLKSDTRYSIELAACLDKNCKQYLSAETVGEGTTGQEIWQIQGTGHSYKTADRVVPDGSTVAYAFQYGQEVGKELEGLTRFYYNPSPVSEWGAGMRAALSEVGIFDTFTPAEDGLKLPCDAAKKVNCPTTGAYWITATQAVPLTSGLIRVFFEAADLTKGSSPKAQISRNFTIDSQDGYVGEDFNTDPNRTTCGGTGSTDYAPGGDCELTVVLGVTGDANKGDTGLQQVRQSKIGFPQLDSWMWDEAVGTFMSITGADSCGLTSDGLFYAQWDGKQWNVEMKNNECAKPMVEDAHGPVIVHLGEARYKLYYEQIIGKFNVEPGKPLRVIYGNGEVTGSELTLEFDDWELETQARDVTFLWPDGQQLTANEESGLGDHYIFVPNGELEEQRMYMNLGGRDDDTPNESSTGLGTALLLNP